MNSVKEKPRKQSLSSRERVSTVHAELTNVPDPKSFSIELARCFAIAMVVLIHITAPPLYQLPTNHSNWLICCLINTLCRPAVPIFLMISGLLLLKQGKDEPINVFVSKRMTKVAIPLMLWSAFFIFRMVDSGGVKLDPASILKACLQPACYHLGFLYLLLGLYLATPVLRAFLRSARKTELNYFIGLWFVSQSLFPLFAKIFGAAPPIAFVVTTGFVGYYLLGHILENYRVPARKVPLLLTLCSVCIIANTLITYILTKKAGHFDEFFFEYSSPLVIVHSILLFVLLQSVGPWLAVRLGRTFTDVVQSVSAASFTIFLLHPLVLDHVVVGAKKLTLLKVHNGLDMLEVVGVAAIATIIICWGFYLVCRKAKVPTWMIP